jgi:prepilin-type N-terminal cleavage/methylation domain-containing protein
MMRARRAFTLIEMLIVLALLAVLSGMVAAGVGAMSRTTDTRAALTAVLDALTLARIDAMRAAKSRVVTLALADDRLRISTEPGKVRSLRAGGVVPVDESGAESVLRARFDGSGRADAEPWRLALGAPGSKGPVRDGVRIWRIEFDPISGAASLIDPAAVNASKESPR